MNAKDKAKELYYKFLFEKSESISCSGAKLFSLISVDEILGLWIQLFHTLKQETIISGKVELSATYIYWQEVKQEIDKL